MRKVMNHFEEIYLCADKQTLQPIVNLSHLMDTYFVFSDFLSYIFDVDVYLFLGIVSSFCLQVNSVV